MDNIATAAVVVVVAVLFSGCCLGGRGGVSVGYLFYGEACGCSGAFVVHNIIILCVSVLTSPLRF